MSFSQASTRAAWVTFLLCACSSTIDRGQMLSELGATPLFQPSNVAEVAAAKPEARLPFVLAVAPPRTHRQQELAWEGRRETASGFRSWTADERATIESWRPELQRLGLISDLVVMPLLTSVQGDGASAPDLESLRVAAARHHAQVVLVVGEVEDSSTWLNPWSILDLTIVGAWFAPGHDIEVVTILEGALIDTQSGYLFASGQGEGRVHARRAWAYADDPKLARGTRAAALAELQQVLLDEARKRASTQVGRQP